MPLNVVGHSLVGKDDKVHLAVLGVGLSDKDILGIQNGMTYILEDVWGRNEFGEQDVVLVVTRVHGEAELEKFRGFLYELFPPSLSSLTKKDWQKGLLGSDWDKVKLSRMPPGTISAPSAKPTPQEVLSSVQAGPRPLRSLVVIAQRDGRAMTPSWSEMKLSELVIAWIKLGQAIRDAYGNKKAEESL